MTGQEFANVIKEVVRDAAIAETIAAAENPPGRKVSEQQKVCSDWYRSLSREQKELLASIVTGAVDSAVFGFFCVIDGVRAIESGPSKGTLELRYLKETSVLLNSPKEDMLHDLYNATKNI